jgi:ribonuclease P protein component
MLPKKHRIPTVFFSQQHRTRRIDGAIFTLRYMMTQNIPSRVAVVVSKRSAPTAVLRNLIKRKATIVVEPFIRKHPTQLQLIFSLTTKAVETKLLTKQQIADDIHTLLSKLPYETITDR